MPELAMSSGPQWWLCLGLLVCSSVVFCMNAWLYAKLSRKREVFLRQLGTANRWHTRMARFGFVTSYGMTVLLIGLLGLLRF